ncbi:MAG: RelA/SpoT family protein [Anaerorhabdus sp.]
MTALNQITREELMTSVKQYIQREENIRIVEKALDYATAMHKNQFRKSGEPYIVHCVNVGYILSTLQAGPKTVAAGILHDVLEDCDIEREVLVSEFDEEIVTLVEGVTKIGNIQFKDEKEYLAANHRKIFIAMAKDVRVILIKLVDRLHNMRTLEFMSEEKQKKIASETLDVYAPIAHRLGISEIKNELEDLSFFYLDREQYYRIAKLVEARKIERDHQVKHMTADITELLTKNKIEFRIFGRSKHLYSIYKKMNRKNKRFEEILDLLALRIVTKTELNCYEILGHIHATYRPIPGRLKDYIAVPKVNLYQSLHTTIVGDEGRIFEVQIRTEEMDSIAEKGIAAHWRYKENKKYDQHQEQKEIEEKLTWFKDFAILNSEQEDGDNPVEYMDMLQKDMFEADVYVMTPNGRVIDLPNGSTPIDFAYRVHTEVGHSCVGAIVNETLVPLNTILKTGDVVEIKTSKQFAGPSEDWLKVVKTSQAKSKIKSRLMKKEEEKREERVEQGEQMLRDEFRKRGFDEKDYMEKKKIEAVFSTFQVSTYIDFMYAIAVKSISTQAVVEKMTNQKRGVSEEDALSRILGKKKGVQKKKSGFSLGLRVNGVDSMMMSLAGCCSPVYGDEIVGYVTKGQGVKVHRTDCPNVVDATNRLLEVQWDDSLIQGDYEAHLSLLSHDRNFLLTDLVTATSQCKASLMDIHSTVNAENLTTATKMKVMVKDAEHLRTLIANLKKVNGVISVERQSF